MDKWTCYNGGSFKVLQEGEMVIVPPTSTTLRSLEQSIHQGSEYEDIVDMTYSTIIPVTCPLRPEDVYTPLNNLVPLNILPG